MPETGPRVRGSPPESWDRCPQVCGRGGVTIHLSSGTSVPKSVAEAMERRVSRST